MMNKCGEFVRGYWCWNDRAFLFLEGKFIRNVTVLPRGRIFEWGSALSRGRNLNGVRPLSSWENFWKDLGPLPRVNEVCLGQQGQEASHKGSERP